MPAKDGGVASVLPLGTVGRSSYIDNSNLFDYYGLLSFRLQKCHSLKASTYICTSRNDYTVPTR
jgi:hypothetical protein